MALQQARAQIAAASLPIEQQIKAEKAANLQKAKDQMGFSKAAAALMQISAPAVQTAYTNAANADAGYSRALGSGVQAQLDQNAGSNNTFLQQMGTPQAALHQAAPVGDIAYGMQGYVPATTLQREGAAWEAQAQLAPGNLLHAGQQQAAEILANDPNLATLQSDLAKLQATQPDVYNKLLTAYNEQAYKNAELNLSGQRLQLDAQKAAVSEHQAQQRIDLSISKAQFEQAHAEQTYGLSYERFMAEQRRANAAQSRLSNEAKSRMYQDATKAAQAYYYGKAPHSTINAKGQHVMVGGERQFSYQQTINALVKQFPGLGPQGAIQIADTLYRPGEGGRPHNSGTGGQAFFAQDAHGNAYMYSVPGGLSPKAQHQVSGLLNLAREYLGTPYVWGGESPKGFDCSGFAQYLYAKVGISIPRTTYTQWDAPNGHAVSRQNLEPGDLVFFRGSDSRGGLPGHVGIYIGDGMMIDAPHTGSVVRVESIDTFGGYMGARRFVAEPSGGGGHHGGYRGRK